MIDADGVMGASGQTVALTVKTKRAKLADINPMPLLLGAILEKKGVFDLLQAVFASREDYPRLRLEPRNLWFAVQT